MKAAGGIRSFEDAEDFLCSAATGSAISAIVKLAKNKPFRLLKVR